MPIKLTPLHVDHKDVFCNVSALTEGSNINIFSFRMLQVNIGETIYPTFTVSRVTQIFKDRDSVLRYKYTHTGNFIWILNFFLKKLHFIDKIFIFFFRFSEACLLEADLWSKLERNDFGAAYQVYLEAQERVLELKKDKALSKYIQQKFKNCNLETRVSKIFIEM